MIQHHPHRTLADLRRKFVRRLAHTGSTFSGVGASGKLGAVQFAAIAEAAASGEEISLNGFGKFKVKEAAAREGRNPATGATIRIAASKKLTFTPAKAVKDKLNG
ncbi:HU family DNA-binding protein [Sphingomonas melonis]|uniref:HU family DNA-binding protein n=1 Tax=Sphingomonas melonis TaxID=152682 RepID=UPI000364B1E5|nr:HU family DNA-binding protein [Sphingomonas melonis]